MATTYQLKTFADLIAAAREELGIQSGDAVSITRIKRDINTIYLDEVVPASRWKWLFEHTKVVKEAKYDSGTASVTSDSTVVTLSTSPTVSYAGYNFSVYGESVVYKIKNHTINTGTLTLDNEFIGSTNATRRFTIWRDTLDLPVNCNEVVEVTHAYRSTSVENCGWQDFKKRATLDPKAEGKPAYYTVSDYIDIVPTEAITALPASLTRTSSGLLKTVVFASTLGSGDTLKIKEGDRISVDSAGHYSYNIADTIVASVTQTNVANDTITFVGKAKKFETAASDTGISVRALTEGKEGERFRQMTVWPAVDSAKLLIDIDFKKEVMPLIEDTDEPAIPVEYRSVLLYGALSRGWSKQRNESESDRNFAKFQSKLAEMKGKWEDSLEKGQLKIDKDYLNRQRRSSGRNLGRYYSSGSANGGGASSSPTSSPSSVAIFDLDGKLTASSNVSITELGYLDGATSNLQAQIDAIVSSSYLDDAESLTTAVLMDNQVVAANVATWTVADFSAVFMDYSLTRGAGNTEGGLINIVSDGTNAAISISGGASLGTSGVTFSVDVSGGMLRLRYTSTNTGTGAVLKYKLLKWLA